MRDLVLPRVVKDDALALLPLAPLVARPDAAAVRHDQPQVAREPRVGRSAVWPQVPARAGGVTRVSSGRAPSDLAVTSPQAFPTSLRPTWCQTAVQRTCRDVTSKRGSRRRRRRRVRWQEQFAPSPTSSQGSARNSAGIWCRCRTGLRHRSGRHDRGASEGRAKGSAEEGATRGATRRTHERCGGFGRSQPVLGLEACRARAASARLRFGSKRPGGAQNSRHSPAATSVWSCTERPPTLVKFSGARCRIACARSRWAKSRSCALIVFHWQYVHASGTLQASW